MKKVEQNRSEKKVWQVFRVSYHRRTHKRFRFRKYCVTSPADVIKLLNQTEKNSYSWQLASLEILKLISFTFSHF